MQETARLVILMTARGRAAAHVNENLVTIPVLPFSFIEGTHRARKKMVTRARLNISKPGPADRPAIMNSAALETPITLPANTLADFLTCPRVSLQEGLFLLLLLLPRSLPLAPSRLFASVIFPHRRNRRLKSVSRSDVSLITGRVRCELQIN